MLAHAGFEPSARNLETHAATSHNSKESLSKSSDQFLAACEARAELLKRLDIEGADDLSDRLRQCGEPTNLTCGQCGTPWEVKKRCNRKWCPVCQRALSTRSSLRYTGICESMSNPLFLTLTVKNWDNLDVDVIRHLRRSLGKLRRLSWWKKCVKGGVAGIEVTNIGNGWHPHIHLVINCRWLGVSIERPPYGCSNAQWLSCCKRSLNEVTEQWSLCTGLKSGVKLKIASASKSRHGDSIAKEILKYSVKGNDLLKYKGEIAPILRMLDGTRLITSFGTCYGHLRDFDKPKKTCACGYCGQSGQWLTEGAVKALMTPARKKR